MVNEDIPEGLRRLIEASSPKVSDSQRKLIENMDHNPERTLRDLEEQGYNTGRKEFVSNYLTRKKK